MRNWIKSLCHASPQTKFFALNWFIYGLAIIVTTIYCYAQLNFGKSDPDSKQVAKTHQPPVNIQ